MGLRSLCVGLALLLLLVAWGHSQDYGTRVAVEQVAAEALDWQYTPQSAKKGCIAGNVATDENYNFYICVPDRRYMQSGHRPYIWLRLKPDPTFIPPEYMTGQ